MSFITINLLPEDAVQPPVYFFTACCNFTQKTKCYPKGTQDFYQILFVTSGTGILNCQGKTYPLSRGCAFFTAHGCPSEYIDTGNLTTAFLTAKGSALPTLLSHYSCGDFIFAEQVNLEEFLTKIQSIIKEYYAHKREGKLSAMTYSFFADFLDLHFHVPLSTTEQIGLYLEQHFRQKLTLEQLATQVKCSISKLCHDFKAAYGCSIFDYILHLRLTYARDYLRTSRDARTKEAALSCGFEDISYFCKAYKKKFGKSPSQDQQEYFNK